MLEVCTNENVITEIQPAISTRKLDQQMSIEGKLEEDTSKNATTEMQSTISTIDANKKMFSEVSVRKGDKRNTLSKTHKSDSRPKSGGIFRKK